MTGSCAGGGGWNRLLGRGFRVKNCVQLIKSVIHLIMSVTDLTRSVIDLIKSVADLIKSVTELTHSVIELMKSVIELTQSVIELIKSVTDLIKSVFDLIKSMTQLIKSINDLINWTTHFRRTQDSRRMKTGHFLKCGVAKAAGGFNPSHRSTQIIRTAVLRSLAAHGFIAAIGIAHVPKAGSFALADDVMEPLRPWIDRELRLFVQGGKRPMNEWMRQAVSVLQLEVSIKRSKLRLLSAIDIYVQSFADAAMSRVPLALKIPMLP